MRISSGIKGFDGLVNNGLPKGDTILLSGPAGSGKKIFGLQFLYSAAEKEHGMYISFEDEVGEIKKVASDLKMDTKKMEKENKLRILRYDPYKLEDLLEVIENQIREVSAERIVIDSASILGIFIKDAADLRRQLTQMNRVLKKNDCTAIILSETDGTNISRFGIEEFVSDGVILLHTALVQDEYRRGLSVIKMRFTDHSKHIHPYKISSQGFIVFPNDKFSLR